MKVVVLVIFSWMTFCIGTVQHVNYLNALGAATATGSAIAAELPGKAICDNLASTQFVFQQKKNDHGFTNPEHCLEM